MAAPAEIDDHDAMSAGLPARRPRSTASRIDDHRTRLGLAYLAAGMTLAALAVTTSLADRFASAGGIGLPTSVSAAIAWAIVGSAPSFLLLLGFSNLGEGLGLWGRRAAVGPVRSIERKLDQTCQVFGPIRLPEGRLVPELVIGPHGLAIFEVLPPPGSSRRHERAWEVRLPDGHWIPIENPLDQASRDAERVRRWLAADDRDFVVKVHAAVIGTDPTVPRSPTCAVITREQVPAFLASLPRQRMLTEDRRLQLVQLLRNAR